ncbi:MAG: sugar transferase [Verrucomicrobia bacterium]|nr:sugar transferase [Verrucomicrobiota bacterium]
MKRLFDLLLVVGTLWVWFPLLGLIAALVHWKLGTPVFFIQPRPGRKGKVFPLIKFRTMTDARAADGQLLPDGARLTPFGRWLRSTSLDELPELFNVLCGHMSLVGPRPLLLRYLSRYSETEAVRHAVRPGLTGWAQVNGRNEASWEARFRLDREYVERQSLRFDAQIVWRTFWAVVRRHGISASGQATKDEFRGTD